MDAEMRRWRDPLALDDDYGEASGPTTEGDRDRHAVIPDELPRRYTHAVITGAPGCGKTMLLRYLALQTISRRLPIFLELKTITEADFDDARNDLVELLFEKAVVAAMHLQASERNQLKGYLLARLAAGEVAIFLDGLDEVRGSSFFPKLCMAVVGFTSSDYRNNTLVVSTRPYSFQVRLEGFNELEIKPLTSQQIESFLKSENSQVRRIAVAVGWLKRHFTKTRDQL